jgi:hypothetical protein
MKMQDDRSLGTADTGNPLDPPSTSNWEDIQREALHCPVLHRMVHHDRARHATREELLMMTVLWLSRERRRMMALEIDRLVNRPWTHTPSSGG